MTQHARVESVEWGASRWAQNLELVGNGFRCVPDGGVEGLDERCPILLSISYPRELGVARDRGQTEIAESGIEWLLETVANRAEIPLVSTLVDREKVLTSGSRLSYSDYGNVFGYEYYGEW